MNGYEMVIGLEVHAQLATKSKLFCGCSADFGNAPNTQCCPVCMGYPGTLPVLNRRAVELAITAGLATHCDIQNRSAFDRKNYFYPDLPKGYQITQFFEPICRNGWLEIDTESGVKRVGITRIHLEEDAGKLIHEGADTLIDHNRCGVPLIEIVSEPQLFSAQEAVSYLKELRGILMFAGVSDCAMNRGQFRADVNLSVRRTGEASLGTRTELKNLNSFQFIAKAIESEFERQVAVLKSGGSVRQETRRFDPKSGKTDSMRQKEEVSDYRYFPEPDLPPLLLTDQRIRTTRSGLPILPRQIRDRLKKEFSLPTEDTLRLTESKQIAERFCEAAGQTAFPKTLANLMISSVLEEPECEENIGLDAQTLAQIAELSGTGVINSGTAKRLIHELWGHKEDVHSYVERHGLAQISDPELLLPMISETLRENEKAVTDFRNGKDAAFQVLVGQMMRKTAGKGNAVIITELLKEKLEKKNNQ